MLEDLMLEVLMIEFLTLEAAPVFTTEIQEFLHIPFLHLLKSKLELYPMDSKIITVGNPNIYMHNQLI